MTLVETSLLPKDVFLQHSAENSWTLGQWARWDGNEYWSSPDGEVALAFRVLGRVALVVTNPVGSSEHFEIAIADFQRFCDSNNLTPAFYCVNHKTQRALRGSNWKTIEVGKEAVIQTAKFATQTSTARILRHAASRAARHNCSAIITRWCEMTENQRMCVREILEERANLRRLPNIGFTVGTASAFDSDEVDLALAVDCDGRILAVTSWHAVRRNGSVAGRTLETISRSKDSFNGVLDFLIGEAIHHFKQQGVQIVSLSGIPLLRSDPSSPDIRQRLKSKAVKIAKARLEPFYGFEGLRRFKQKFEPELHSLYLVYPNRSDLVKVAVALLWAYFL